MSKQGTYYVAMISTTRCDTCDGTGLVPIDDDVNGDCDACNGTGETDLRWSPLRTGTGRSISLYTAPAGAYAAARRAHRPRRLEDSEIQAREVHLDDCEAVEWAWSQEQRYERAEARMLHWHSRLDEIRERMNAPAFEFAHDYKPKLTAGDWELLRRIVDVLDDGVPMVALDGADRDAIRLRIAGELRTKTAFDRLDEQHRKGAAELRRMLAERAASEGKP